MTTTMVVPERTAEQRMAALREANRVRTLRARLKRDVKAGRVPIAEVIESPPEWAESMKVWDLLLAAPKWGRVKATKALGRQSISPSKTLVGMTARQRAALVGELCPETLVALAPQKVWPAPVRAQVLGVVVELGEGVRAADVADRTDLDVMQVSRCLGDLHRRGLVVRSSQGVYRAPLSAEMAQRSHSEGGA